MSLSLDGAVKNLILYISDLTSQVLKNSTRIQLGQKQESAKISDVRESYTPDKERIRNEIDSLDEGAMSDEYSTLVDELKELNAMEEAEIERIEEEANDAETAIQLENDQLQTRIEAAKADKESFEEARQQNTENFHNYFN